MDSVLILTEFSEAVMTCLKLLLYFTHITASLWVVIMSFDDILKTQQTFVICKTMQM